MHESVLKVFPSFSTRFEGRVHSMYLDILGLITTGIGNLIDTPEETARLPWFHEATGERATEAEIKAAWHQLKARQDIKTKHWRFAAELNDLRLTDEAIDELVEAKLKSNEAYLKSRYYPGWDDFPADAQLGILSMAWALGPGFPRTFKNFTRHVLAGEWNHAIVACKIREEGNPGVVPRNAANRVCFSNADVAMRKELARTVLHWPEELSIAPLEA